MKRRILAVIVLYKCAPHESVAFKSLLSAARQAPGEDLQLLVLLHDNTPGASPPAQLPPGVEYMHDPGNSGLAGAYNRALAEALQQGYEWLLTLDQDTELPPGSLRILLHAAAALEARPEVAAIVPQIRAGGRLVSPNYFAAGFWPRWFPAGYAGIPEQTVFAFNSGSTLRTAALRQIGGYSPWFWLDNSDSVLYRQLAKFGKRVYVAGDLQLDHDFSMLNLQARVTPERYRNLLMAESAFWDLEMNTLAGLERTGRLAGRLFKHWRRRDPVELRRLTWQALRRRLFHSRAYRIARWRRATAERFGAALQVPRFPPIVSVCMAAYNGEGAIEAQLRSILPQLQTGDEVVVVDDASSGRTVERIEEFKTAVAAAPAAPRIVLIQHSTNQGAAPTFEDAVRSATGDILFLCDGESLWAPDKVRRMLQVFETHPDAQVVSTGVALIDEDGRPLSGAEFPRRRRFTSNLAANLVHNRFQGPSMAFRSSLVRHILPFPKGRLFPYAAWIAARNTLTGGATAYLDEPLLLCPPQTSGRSRLGRWKQFWLQLRLATALLRRALRRT